MKTLLIDLLAAGKMRAIRRPVRAGEEAVKTLGLRQRPPDLLLDDLGNEPGEALALGRGDDPSLADESFIHRDGDVLHDRLHRNTELVSLCSCVNASPPAPSPRSSPALHGEVDLVLEARILA